MKSSKIDPLKKTGDSSGNGKLLRDIETISNALYLDKTRPKNSVPNLNSRSQSVRNSYSHESTSKPKESNNGSLQKEKRSIWNWKGLMPFTRNRRFNCCFSLQVHSIEGLPSCFEDLDLCVHFERRDEKLVSPPARVMEGVAEFEGHLTLTCLVYGSRSGAHHSAKYEAKHFLLYATLLDSPELDIGKHRVDLTRFLPLTLEELEDEKSSSRWTTSFNLSGIAKGACMNVSFGYTVVGSNGNSSTTFPVVKRDISRVSNVRRNRLSMDESEIKSMIQRAGSLPARSSTSSQPIEDIKDLHEVLPESNSDLAKSVGVLYRKLDEEKFDFKGNPQLEVNVSSNTLEGKLDIDLVSGDGEEKKSEKHEHEKFESFSVEQVIEAAKEEVKLDEDSLNSETENLAIFEVGGDIGNTELQLNTEDLGTTESLMKDLELALQHVSIADTRVNSPGGDSEKSEEDDFAMIKSDYKLKRKAKSLCLDDVINSVADDFLNMLGIEHSPFGLSSESEPESPRERLLRQFEKDSLAAGCPLFDFNMEDTSYDDDFDLFQNKLNLATEAEDIKPRASMIEDLETEKLMHEWGINEKAFVKSPSGRSNEFGNPIDMEDGALLPSLGEGMGPFIKTKNGGFLRTMDPTHFRDAKSGGTLVMQVSSPVVVPAEMGKGIMDILERLASAGIEKLSMQANKLMPLDDVTGKTMQQVAWEGLPGLEGSERQFQLNDYSTEVEHSVASSEFRKELDSEYVSLEDLAPLAMDKIEALSIEGLRIQSGMSNEEAPSNLTPQTFGEISALEGMTVNLGGSLGLDGAGGLQLLDINKDSGGEHDDDLDSLMSLSVTLDEWLRIDSGEIDDEDGISERTSKILAAHHASDSIRDRSKFDRKRGKSGRKCGLLGNNFTVALLVQLRDPIRNFEPVGTPMLALIQVERVFVPPKPKFYSTVSDLRNTEEDEEIEIKQAKKEDIVEEKKEDEEVIQFKISEVHVAGLKTEPGRKKIWGSSAQQQAGSRWLVANGMGKGKKAPIVKSKGVGKSVLPAMVTAQPGDTLWSISAQVLGSGGKWKELANLNPHIRNPNVKIPSETIIKLR